MLENAHSSSSNWTKVTSIFVDGPFFLWLKHMESIPYIGEENRLKRYESVNYKITNVKRIKFKENTKYK